MMPATFCAGSIQAAFAGFGCSPRTSSVTRSSKSMPFCMASVVGVGSRRNTRMKSSFEVSSWVASAKGLSCMLYSQALSRLCVNK